MSPPPALPRWATRIGRVLLVGALLWLAWDWPWPGGPKAP